MSVDVDDNKGQKKLAPGMSVDVDENRQVTWVFWRC
jgi:hypothetical protein